MFWSHFQKIVSQYPDHIAILDRGKSITYQELMERAAAVGENLKAEPEDKIGIAIDKSTDYIIALLGVWYTGAAFIPLPSSLPTERQEFILEDAQIKNVLTAEHTQDTSKICTPHIPTEEDLAYIMYTSGSTGQPKGVMVEHRGITNFINAQIKAFQVKDNSRYLFYLSTAFDASLSDIGVTLLSGATLVIEEDADLRDGTKLIEILHKRQITHTDIPPSLLRILEPQQIPDTLETIIIGGEACSIDAVKKWAEHLRVINVYGPTETTVCTSLCQCDAKAWDKPLLGETFPNVDYKIIDEELYIGGLQLARGYLNQPALTDEKFVTVNEERFYKTGDRVKKHKNGDIEFLGRMDRQFKLRGLLIEPDEIEARLTEYNGIEKAAVLKRPIHDGGSDVLIAFITGTAKENDLKNHLSKTLPVWMIPQHIITLKNMPETITGKNNMQSLSSYILNVPTEEKQKPQTELEKTLHKIWSKVLNHNDFGTTDHFFHIGGDSLNIINMTLEAEKHNLRLSPAALVQYPTIQTLAQSLKTNEGMNGALATSWIKNDISFDQEWQSLFQSAKSRPKNKKSGAIFLTGATGGLGGTLLQTLLAETDDDIYCLVRDPARMSVHNDRIHLMTGDLTQKYFGLTETEWRILTEKIDRIYHCAAWVNIVQDYDTLRPANIVGTQEVLRFSCTGMRKHIHYASTLSVFVATDQNSGRLLETNRLENTQYVYGGYAQTKWAAEYLLLQVPADACDITHYRFGLITGDTKTGACAKNDFLKMFVEGVTSLGIIPDGFDDNLHIDITPVDYAVSGFFHLSQHGTHDIYHIANPKSLSLGRLIDAIGTIKKCPASDWKTLFQDKTLSSTESATYLALCRCLDDFENYRTMDLFQATNVCFDTTQTYADYPVPCPAPTDDLLQTYLDFILKQKNGRDAA